LSLEIGKIIGFKNYTIISNEIQKICVQWILLMFAPAWWT